VRWKGKAVSTGIFKARYPIRLWNLDFDGDRHADLAIHGETDKAAYVYPAEYYAWWRGVRTHCRIRGSNLTSDAGVMLFITARRTRCVTGGSMMGVIISVNV